MTLQQVFDLIHVLNERAKIDSVPYYSLADSEENPELAEDLRTQARQHQCVFFQSRFHNCIPSDKDSIIHWIENDEGFKSLFNKYWGDLNVDQRPYI